jgi:hypothetical protein
VLVTQWAAVRMVEGGEDAVHRSNMTDSDKAPASQSRRAF